MTKSSTGAYSKLLTVFRSKENRLHVFYILAFIPLPLIAYHDIRYLSPLMFGFLLLLLKSHNLSAYREANNVQRYMGKILVLGSFIIYLALVYFLQFPLFYGGAAVAYIAYILGLFLAFFDLSALREAFTSTFIIAAATSIAYVSFWLELYLSPYIIPLFTSLLGTISNGLGVKVTVQYPDLITLYALRGTIPLQIIWGCVGAYGALVFSILVVIVLSEEPVSLKTKILWAVIGIIGVLVLNVLRVVIILVIAYYYDFNVAELAIHPYLGYALFLTWLMLFLTLFSKRESIFKKLNFLSPKTTAE